MGNYLVSYIISIFFSGWIDVAKSTDTPNALYSAKLINLGLILNPIIYEPNLRIVDNCIPISCCVIVRILL